MPKRKQRLKSYTVHLMTAYSTWMVRAVSKKDAISKCQTPPEFDANDKHTWLAEEEE